MSARFIVDRIAAGVGAGAVLAIAWAAVTGQAARADGGCRLLQYSFEPDCLNRDATGACRFDPGHPDLGPQIAVWIESADGTTFVDTAMVTNAVAVYGIGNRPGRWDFRSGPRFAYGRRPMALPVWAHRRGVLYDSLVMDDGYDDDMTAHMAVSSPEPFFCRPMLPSEVVDAVTCPSGLFRSAKGLFDTTMPRSYYPPRADLVNWDQLCTPSISIDGTACDYGDAREFGLVNDTDVIASATPPYDRAFSGTWIIPATLPYGDYALGVEVGKEFDGNASFTHTSYISPGEAPYYGMYGQDGNVGQPSVVYRVPFQLAATPVPGVAAAGAAGYGDWTGDSGVLSPMDATISGDPGSGAGRLRVSDGPGGPGRVHLTEVACAPVDCAQAPPLEQPAIDPPVAAQGPASVQFSFRQVSDGGAPVIAYDLRFTPISLFYVEKAVDESTFPRWTPAMAPSVAAPGTVSEVVIGDLAPETTYAVGMRAQGACGWSSPSFVRVTTGKVSYKKLSGCVIATAAYGSAMHPDVALLRRERDWAVARSGAAALAARLYAESAPPLARLVGRSDAAREAVRALLRPIVAVNRAVVAAVGR